MTDALPLVVAGAGRFGSLHARVWQEAGARVAGVVDVDGARARTLAEPFAAASGTDLAEVVARTGARLVVIASDEASHAALAQVAMAAGCSVFVEKPFALSATDAWRMHDTAEERGLHAIAGQISRFAQPYTHVKERLQAGGVGDLWALRLRRDFSRAWFEDFGSRVHPLWESGIHDIDLAVFLAESAPRRVFATQSGAAGAAAPSVFTILIEFESGVTATVESAWAIPDRGPQTIAGALALDGTIAAECEAIGSRGMLRQRLVSDAVTEWTEDGVVVPDLSLWPESSGRVGGALRSEVDEALAVLTGTARSRVPSREAVWGVLIAEAAERSLGTGLPVEIDVTAR